MSELPAETRPARLKVEASPHPFVKPRQRLVPVSTTAVHTRTAARARARICKVGLWTNNAPSSSASTHRSRLDVHLRPSGEAFFVPREGKGMDDLVIRLQGLSVALVVLEATGGFEATIAAAPGRRWAAALCR